MQLHRVLLGGCAKRTKKLDIPIKSILNQQFKNWELLVIDDGSTDQTNGLIQNYSSHNIHYFILFSLQSFVIIIFPPFYCLFTYAIVAVIQGIYF